ncbi:MAG: DUF6056 family protein [Sphingobacteriales bacterium JAD_PAG50586_3]|nr:MAG: DUF6056 family protein [Sphingobacteriales bacterium JAD_PAG50586_3]
MAQNLFNRLLAASVILFVLLWMFLHFFNHFASDDYQLIYERFYHGIVGATYNQYITYCGRWLPLGFTFTMLSFSKMPGFLFLYGLLTIGFATLASYRFFRVLSNIYLPEKVSSKYVLAVSVFFIFSFFMLTPEKSEVWFWYNSTSMYLWNLLFCLFGISFLLWDRGKTEYIFTAASFAYVGAASEPFAIVVIMVLSVVVVYRAITKIGFSFKYLFALLVTLSAFIINVISEGNEIRSNQLPPASGRVAVVNMVQTVLDLIVQHGAVFFSTVAVFFACWVFIGSQLTTSFKHFQKFKFLYLLAAFVVLKVLWVSVLFPAAYTLGGIPPQRVQGALFFMMALFLCGTGLYSGLAIGKSKLIDFAGIAAISCILLGTGFIFYKHIGIEPVYAKTLKSREKLLNMYKEEYREEVLYLAPLPDPGFLYSAEITEDTTKAVNQQLKSGLGLSYNIAREKQK